MDSRKKASAMDDFAKNRWLPSAPPGHRLLFVSNTRLAALRLTPPSVQTRLFTTWWSRR